MASQINPSVKQQVKAFQQQVSSLLAEKPMSMKDIAAATGARQGAIRSALTPLICSGQVEGSGGKPVIYQWIANRETRNANTNGESPSYTGTRLPYFRPGSYSPPMTLRAPMFVTDVPEAQMMDPDWSF